MSQPATFVGRLAEAVQGRPLKVSVQPGHLETQMCFPSLWCQNFFSLLMVASSLFVLRFPSSLLLQKPKYMHVVKQESKSNL